MPGRTPAGRHPSRLVHGTEIVCTPLCPTLPCSAGTHIHTEHHTKPYHHVSIDGPELIIPVSQARLHAGLLLARSALGQATQQAAPAAAGRREPSARRVRRVRARAVHALDRGCLLGVSQAAYRPAPSPDSVYWLLDYRALQLCARALPGAHKVGMWRYRH